MDQLLEVTNIKIEPTESTSSDHLDISSKVQVENVKQESECLVRSEIYIKTESFEDENEFLVIKGTSIEMYPDDDIKFETEESFIKIKCTDMQNDIMQDPLDVGSGTKDEEDFPIDLDGMSTIKTESTKVEKDKTFLENDKDDSQWSGSNLVHKQLLIRNDPECTVNKYVCKECNKIFGWKSHLDKHLRIHTGEKPFQCVICKKSFSQKATLDTHMLVHSGEKPYVCDICQKVFSRKVHLITHKMNHSGVKPFSCYVCGTSFRLKQTLVRHARIHVSKKPYACEICNKSFVQKSDLTTHTRTHTGEKPYCCTVCTKSFANKANLNRHKKIHKNY